MLDIKRTIEGYPWLGDVEDRRNNRFLRQCLYLFVCVLECAPKWKCFKKVCAWLSVCACMTPFLIVCMCCWAFYQALDKLQPCWVRSSEKATYGNLQLKTTAEIVDFPLSQSNYFMWQTWGLIGGICVYSMLVWFIWSNFFFFSRAHPSLTLYVQVRVDTWWDCLKFFSLLVSWAFCFCLRHFQKLSVIAFHKKITISLYSVPAVLGLVCLAFTALSSKRWGLEAVLYGIELYYFISF